MSSAASLYSSVISDVISSIRESFLDEAVDEQVLQELKTLWEQKLAQSKTVDPNNRGQEALLDAKMAAGRSAGIDIDSKLPLNEALNDFKDNKITGQYMTPNNAGDTDPMKTQTDSNKILPVHVNLPPRPNPLQLPGQDTESRTIMLNVPAHALQSSGPSSAMLQQVVTQAMGQSMRFSSKDAAAFIQNQINAAFRMNSS